MMVLNLPIAMVAAQELAGEPAALVQVVARQMVAEVVAAACFSLDFQRYLASEVAALATHLPAEDLLEVQGC